MSLPLFPQTEGKLSKGGRLFPLTVSSCLLTFEFEGQKSFPLLLAVAISPKAVVRNGNAPDRVRGRGTENTKRIYFKTITEEQ